MNLTKATYDKLITPDGQPQYGRFQKPFSEINYRDFDYCNNMDKPANWLQKHFHFNQFHFIGIHSKDFTLACAIANVRYVANAFVYLFDHGSAEMQQRSYLQPLGLGCRQSNRPFAGASRFSKGNARFEILGRSKPNRYNLSLIVDKDISIDVDISEPPAFEATAVCTRTGYNGWAYTQKHNTLTVEGSINWGQRSIAVEKDSCLASSDWSCGYMRRETAWNWASISAFLPDQTRLGLNLACGVNETSFTENTLWIDGKAHCLEPALFEFNRKNRMEPWQITNRNRQVELTFVPEARHEEKVNAYLVASNFSQIPGRYYGTIRDNDGHKYQLDGIYGLAEDHYAKW